MSAACNLPRLVACLALGVLILVVGGQTGAQTIAGTLSVPAEAASPSAVAPRSAAVDRNRRAPEGSVGGPIPEADAPQPLARLASASAHAPEMSLRPVARDPWAAPAMRWDGHPEDTDWTRATLAALRGPGAPLARQVPADIEHWCPGYVAAGEAQRRAFWAGLISALAWHESTHQASAVGGGGRWFGLVQISPGTARARGCQATSGQALLDAMANIRCGARIMGANVARDGVVAAGRGGVAAEWGPFQSSRKREDMRAWLREQDYCRPQPADAMRPVPRPMQS